jgi:hypothetical protein
MQNLRPIFTWFVQDADTNDYDACKAYTEPGALQTGDELVKNIRIHNGYGGAQVDNSYNTKLVLAFKDYEDNFLLNLIQVKVNDSDYTNLNIELDRGYIDLGTIYKNDYVDLKIKIGPVQDNMKTSLKSLIFYLENDKF